MCTRFCPQIFLPRSSSPSFSPADLEAHRIKVMAKFPKGLVLLVNVGIKPARGEEACPTSPSTQKGESQVVSSPWVTIQAKVG